MLIRGAGALGMMGFDKWGIFDRGEENRLLYRPSQGEELWLFD